jgi:hypothetical protein
MVFMSTNLYRVTFQVFTYPAGSIVKIVFDRIIDQVFSVFSTEYYMRVYFGKRLWHRNVLSGLCPFPQGKGWLKKTTSQFF